MTYFFVFREDLARFRYPTDLDTAKDLGRVLSKYKDTHYNTVLMAVVVTYVLYPFSNVHLFVRLNALCTSPLL